MLTFVSMFCSLRPIFIQNTRNSFST